MNTTCSLKEGQALTGCCSGVMSRRSAPSLLMVTSLQEEEAHSWQRVHVTAVHGLPTAAAGY